MIKKFFKFVSFLNLGNSLINKIVPAYNYVDNTLIFFINETCINNNISIIENMMDKYYPCMKSIAIYNHNLIYKVYYELINETDYYCITNDIDPIEPFYNCVIEITYDVLFTIPEIKCVYENVSDIYYDEIYKPYSWSLDDIDDSIDSLYSYPLIQNINNSNVEIWILDTGINDQHREFFKGQIIHEDSLYTRNEIKHAHGTGVASCSGGKNYGTSKNLFIHNYPVCRTERGTCSSIDMDNALHHIINYLKINKKRIVINMSVGSNGGFSISNTSMGIYYNSLFDEINKLGGIIVVAAGNSNEDACNWFYSFSENVISVGARDSKNIKATFSNHGLCVDIYGPGVSVPTAYGINENEKVTWVTGTSFAAPYITGVVANLLISDSSLKKDNIIKILQSNTIPVLNCEGYCRSTIYKCNNKCCTSKIKGTRLNAFCKSLTIEKCNNEKRRCYTSNICY